ncbi:PGPGW domain-containing protein [Candidatus Spongiisocius sp.]|uniref:PGPGW domain-containing protein n=1 Tax=Candidatus Spongiisocius sp. TaxID=3101273 RepID=UPI003B5CCB8C
MSIRKDLRKALVAIGGGLLVLVGVAGFVLPILPGTVLLVAGLLLWSSEFRWARDVLARVRAWLADRSAKR